MLMGWKEGKDLYLVILLMMGVVLVEGYLFTLGRERGVRGGGAEAESASGVGTLSVARAMGSSPDDTLFTRVTGPRPLVFPDDHGPHPDHRTEWWYITGNLDGPGGERFGVQFTLFRHAVAPRPPSGTSAWGTNQLYLGHLAVTDVAGRRHLHVERLARGAAGLAGAEADPFRVWLEGWELWGPDAPSTLPSHHPDAVFPLRIRAGEEDFALDLRLEAGKGMILQGDRGYSRKGAAPENASIYFSYPRMPASGTIRIGDRIHPVTGLAWMDREWSTSALDPDQVGWDWFALQLDTGEDLMLFQLRREDGSPHPVSGGVLVGPDGESLPLVRKDSPLSADEGSAWELEVLGHWSSPVDGARYPSAWRIELPGRGLRLEVRPVLPDQEMKVSVRYWEGAVDVVGEGPGGARVSGRGYVELTGYAPTGEG